MKQNKKFLLQWC